MIRRHADSPTFARGEMPARANRSSAYSHLTWACGGFLIGAVCWHMVGFWSFIDRVLDETAIERNAPATVTTDLANGGSSKLVARLRTGDASDDCVSRIQSVNAGETHVTPCLQPVVAMRGDLTATPLVQEFRQP